MIDPAHRDPVALEALSTRLHSVLGPRFEVIRPAAVGGMATIFQVRHTLHRGLLAAKVLHTELALRPETIESFRREAAHQASLAGHPSAVPVFDFHDADGLLLLVMPWIDGEDLDRIFHRAGPFSRDAALMLAAQVSSFLCHAESNGIVHGDLTPGNLRLDRFDIFRVLDFGLSRATNDATTRPLGGTPLYISPEQAAGHPPDIRGDLYSLGAILFEALTATPLYTATSLKDLAAQRSRAAWQLPLALQQDAPLAELLNRLLASDPAQRMQSAFELSGALEAFGFPRPEFQSLLRPNPAQASLSRRRRLNPG